MEVLAIDRGLRRELIKVKEGEGHIDLHRCILVGAPWSNIHGFRERLRRGHDFSQRIGVKDIRLHCHNVDDGLQMAGHCLDGILAVRSPSSSPPFTGDAASASAENQLAEQMSMKFFSGLQSVISLGEMLEFYDSTHKLNLSFNKQITIRGWTEIFKAIRNVSLTAILLSYFVITDKILIINLYFLYSYLFSVVRFKWLIFDTLLFLTNHCLLYVEFYVAILNLLLDVFIWRMLIYLARELYLGENNLQSTDGAHLYQLISCNTSIQMLDLRNNQLTDNGVRKMCEALVNPDVCKKSALSAIVLWNTKITGACMDSLAQALHENHRLETLNIGSNNLGVVGMQNLRHALCGGSNLHRLGLQNTQMTCESRLYYGFKLLIFKLYLHVGSAGLLALHSAMKMNTSITLMNLDQSCALANNAKVRPYQDEFRRYFDEIKQYCERNKILVLRKITAHAGEIKEAEDKDNVISQKEERGKSGE
uniref:Ribonuclease inhibitor n=1 Tax=Heterorhabditis bacteriophora TaxID=37862 RepID=A0A1I7WQD5_HETBA